MRVSLMLAALALTFPLASLAKSSTPTNEPDGGWVAVQWRPQEAPIVLPVLYRTRATCEKDNRSIQEVVRSTVKIERQTRCAPVLRDQSGPA